jgi:hypothetical protein
MLNVIMLSVVMPNVVAPKNLMAAKMLNSANVNFTKLSVFITDGEAK